MALLRYLRKKRALRKQMRQAQAHNQALEQTIQQAFLLVRRQQASEAEAVRAVLDSLKEQASPLTIDQVVSAWPRTIHCRTLFHCQILLMRDKSKLFVLQNEGDQVMMTRSPNAQKVLRNAA